MKYVNISRLELIKYMPATIRWIEALDSSLTDNEIILRDTDHAYTSLRFEYTNYHSQNLSEIEEKINNYIRHHCCLCGSRNEIHGEDSDDVMLNTFCGRCYAYRQGLYERIKYNITHCIKTDINPKVRIKLLTGKMAHTRLINLLFDSQFNNIVIHNGERANLIGVDLGIRDNNDERVYDGDIVICKMLDGRCFGGMLLDFTSSNPQWVGERFMVCHGFGNFPSPLSLAKEFKIIGNVGECSSFNGFGPSEENFEQWFYENQEKFNSYF